MKTYTATGFVLGKCWGGGFGAYPSCAIKGKTLKGLLKYAEKLLKTGGLDSGMGFEYLKGAGLCVAETETIILKGKTFSSVDYENYFIGELTEQDKDFLLEQQY